MVRLKNIFYRPKSPPKTDSSAGVGLVLAPGPDDGLYVKFLVEDGPAWKANEEYCGPRNGKEGVIRVGDCLLDIQEQHEDGNWGRKYDVFAKDLKTVVLPKLLGKAGSIVELSFRRIVGNGQPFVVTSRLKRGRRANRVDIAKAHGSNALSAEDQNMYAELDEDGSGDISLEEVMRYIQKHPLPGQTDSWEVATLLFSKADKDGSGKIDVDEFKEGFSEVVEKLAGKAVSAARQAAYTVEESFREQLSDIRENLLDTIRVITRPYMLTLQRMISDPEDLYLVHSMYKLEVKKLGATASAEEQLLHKKGLDGEYVLQTFMVDSSKGPNAQQQFWVCFRRVLNALQRAQYLLGNEGSGNSLELTNEEEEELAIVEVKKVVKMPGALTAQEILAQRSQLPQIKNLVGRTPGRGIPVRCWKEFDVHQDISQRQIEQGMPPRFWGRTESVHHLLSCLDFHRLSTIIGEWGCGKTSVVRVLLHTLQTRARSSPAGFFMYRDGAFLVSCSLFVRTHQVMFMTALALGRLTNDVSELVLAVADKNFLLILDGLDSVLADPHENSLLKMLLEKLLEGAPALTLICTAVAPLGVPYENIVGLSRLADSELARLINANQHDSILAVQSHFHSGDNVCSFMHGNPLAALVVSGLLADRISNDDLFDIINNHQQQDVVRLKLQTDANGQGLDPWRDGVAVQVSRDGVRYGNALCIKAWLRCALGNIQSAHTNAYDTVYFLSYVPAGLDFKTFSSTVTNPSSVFQVLACQYRLIEVVDANGLVVDELCYTSAFFKNKSEGNYSTRLRPSVLHLLVESKEACPGESRRLLKMTLGMLERQAERILKLTAKFQISQALYWLSLSEILTQQQQANFWACINFDNTCFTCTKVQILTQQQQANFWACINFDNVMRPDVAGSEDSLDMVHSCSQIGMYLALIMLALGRFEEALLAVTQSSRFCEVIIDDELSVPQIRRRLKQESIRMKGLLQLAKNLRLAGEIKLTLGAHASAAQDLAGALMLESPVKYSIIGVDHKGSRIGQADVLWSLAECELQRGNLTQAASFVVDALRVYQQGQATLGVAVSKNLAGQIKSMAGDLVGALKDLSESIFVFREFNQLERLAEALVQRCELMLVSSSLARARDDLEEARGIFEFTKDTANEALTWKIDGEISVATGELVKAVEQLTYAYNKAERINHIYVMAEATRLLGEIACVQVVLNGAEPRYKVAAHNLKKALALYESIGCSLGGANTHRALATVFRKIKKVHHYETHLRLALECYSKINHRLGVALIKGDLARLAALRNNSEAANELLEEVVPVMDELETRYRVMETSGLLKTIGQDDKDWGDGKDNTFMVEWDPWWQARMSQINYKAAGEANPADLIRKVLKNSALSIENSGLKLRMEKVGNANDELLDLPQTWIEGKGWQFSDAAEHKAFDEIYFIALEKGEQQSNEAAKLRGAARKIQQLCAVSGMSSKMSDAEILAKAESVFRAFDFDGSGQMDMEELQQSLRSVGIEIDKKECKDLMSFMDDTGDGKISSAEFKGLIIESLRGEDDGGEDPAAALLQYENKYKAQLKLQQKAIKDKLEAAGKLKEPRQFTETDLLVLSHERAFPPKMTKEQKNKEKRAQREAEALLGPRSQTAASNHSLETPEESIPASAPVVEEPPEASGLGRSEEEQLKRLLAEMERRSSHAHRSEKDVAGEALRTARLEAMVEHRKEQKRKEAEEAGLTKNFSDAPGTGLHFVKGLEDGEAAV